MVRFRVVKGSHLLLAVAVVVLAAVVAFIAIQYASGMEQAMEAKVLQTFASAGSEDSSLQDSSLQIRVLPDPSPSPEPGNGMHILIYHTHTHEAYAQVEEDPYIAVEAWRTEDDEHSVVRLGSALAAELRDMGYNVTHDATDHEQQDINQAYVRSLETLEAYSEEFDLAIDLHRDAYVDSLALCHDYADREYAQLMLLVGRGDAYEQAQKPDYEANLRWAQQLTSALNRQIPGICRNVTVKQGRYNQHIGERAMLVEVGHNMNTLEQALNSIPCLAQAIDTCLKQKY